MNRFNCCNFPSSNNPSYAIILQADWRLNFQIYNSISLFPRIRRHRFRHYPKVSPCLPFIGGFRLVGIELSQYLNVEFHWRLTGCGGEVIFSICGHRLICSDYVLLNSLNRKCSIKLEIFFCMISPDLDWCGEVEWCFLADFRLIKISTSVAF